MCSHKFIGLLGLLRNMEILLLTFSFRHLSETLRKNVAIVLVTITNPLQNNLRAIDLHRGMTILTQISHCIIGSLVYSINMLLIALVHNTLVILLAHKKIDFGRVLLKC